MKGIDYCFMLNHKHVYNNMFPINSTDRLIFVNINNSYEAFINSKRTSSYFRESLFIVKYWNY